MADSTRNIQAFAPAARTASANSADLKNNRFKGCHAIIDVTSLAAGTVTLDSGESDKATATITCASAVIGVKASGTITCDTAIAGGQVVVNGLLYTAVAGAKANDTEFSIDTSDTATATDLADSIDDDTRTGTLNDLTATASVGVVTIVQTVTGASGNATTLVTSSPATLTTSGVVFTGGVDVNTVTVNGLLYTAVTGVKANDTEFSIDTSDIATATDLADSIDDDVRVGLVNDLTAVSGGTAVVTCTSSIGGSIGNTTAIESSDGSTLAVTAFAGGLDNALVSGITVDSIEVMSGTEIFDTSLTVTAANIADNINAFTSTPNYEATSSGAVITIHSLNGGNTFVVVSSSAVIATTDVNLADGTPSVVFAIEGKDERSGKYYTLLTAVAITAESTVILKVYPGLTAAANLVASDGLPMDFRVTATNGDSDSVTYQVNLNMLL